MNCPNCNQELKDNDFFNIGLSTICPNCKKVLIFNPSMAALMVFLAIFYLIWLVIPPLSNFLYDFILGFVIMFVLMMAAIWIMLKFKLGKAILKTEKTTNNKKS